MKDPENNYPYQKENSYLIEEDQLNFNDLLQGILRRKRYVFSSTILIFLLSIFFSSFERIFYPVYKGSFSMLTNDPMLENASSNTSNRSDANKTSLQYTQYENIALSKSNYDADTLIELLKSPIYLNSVEKKLNLKKSSISKIITIKPPKSNFSGSNKKVIDGILNVEINSRNKKMGRLILENLADIYLKSSLERRQQRLNDGLKFLDKQAPSISAKKSELESKIVIFREKNKLLFPSEEGKNIKTQQTLIDKEIRNINFEKDRLTNIRDQIINGKLTGMGFKEKLGEAFLIRDRDQETLSELIALEIDLTKAKTKFTSNSSVIKNLNSRLNEVQNDLRKQQIEAIDTALKLNLGELNSAKIQKKEIEEKFVKQPELIKQYKNLEQELDFINQNLLGLEKARESFQLEIAQKNIPWRIISPPEMDDKPFKPKFFINIIIGALAGVLIGIVVALIRDRIDNVFHSPIELKKIIESPLFGSIPYLEEIKNILEDDNKYNLSEKNKFIYEESFRYLFNSIKSKNVNNKDSKVFTVTSSIPSEGKNVNNKDSKVFAVTSSIPSEGKNVISILLSKVIASMDQKILLIDADMRKPSIHRDLNINNEYGLSNILIDESSTFEKAVQRSSNNQFLDILTAGPVPSNSAKLLGSTKFQDFIRNIKDENIYDFIVINNTPLLGLTDSLLVCENVDVVLIAVSMNKVNKNLVKESILRISKIPKSPIYGLVTNFLERYQYLYYGSNYLDYSNTFLEYYKKNSNPSDKNNESNLRKMFKKNRYLYIFYKKINTFISWLNE